MLAGKVQRYVVCIRDRVDSSGFCQQSLDALQVTVDD